MSDLGQGNQDWVQNIFGNIPSRLAKCNSAKLCDCDVGWVVVRLWLPGLAVVMILAVVVSMVVVGGGF